MILFVTAGEHYYVPLDLTLFLKKLLSGQRSGNDCLGRLLGNTGLTSTMQLNDIPDEGEALTSNPLTKRQ